MAGSENLIRQYRQERGLSQAKLAQLLGIKQAKLSVKGGEKLYRRGGVKLGHRTLSSMDQYLGVCES